MIATLRKFLGPVIDFIVKLIGRITWAQTSPITQEDKAAIMALLKDNYYIILTRRRNHLSTHAIAFTNFLLTGKWGYYSHVLMNLEDEVPTVRDFRLMEATSAGVHYSDFDTVFGSVDGVCLMKPSTMAIEEWTSVLDYAKTCLGKPYDTLYDLANDNALSCVELVRIVLEKVPNYGTDFADFERMILKSKNLAPQMFRDCSDFEVVREIKR